MSVREASGNSNAAQGLLDKTPLFGGHDDVDDLTLDEMRLKILEKEEMYFSLRLLLKISKETMYERNEVKGRKSAHLIFAENQIGISSSVHH